MKWLWKAIVVVLAIAFLWGLYDAISGRAVNRRLSNTISSLRADNDFLTRRIESAQGRIVELTETLAGAERLHIELEKELERSRAVSNDLSTENRRLTELIAEGTKSTAGIEGESRAIAESIDRAIEIVGRIEENYTGQ